MTEKATNKDKNKKPPKTEQESFQDQLRIIADKRERHILTSLVSGRLGPSNTDVEYFPHTLLKLSYLNYYLDIFLKTAKSYKTRGYFDKIVFIDAFAGSGLVRIGGSKFNVLGSTILAAMDGRFDQIISVEIDPKRASLLSSRCNALGMNNVTVMNENVNNVIECAPKKFSLGRKSIIILFIDPEGMEPELTRFIPLSDAARHMDIIMNFTWGVYRLEGRINYNHGSADIARMKKMIPGYEDGDAPDEKLAEFFEEKFHKTITKKVDIRGQQGYSMILRTRETKAGSPWTNGMDKFGDFLSTLDDDRALEALRIVMGDQSTLL